MSDDKRHKKGYKFSADIITRRTRTASENRQATPRYQNILTQLRQEKTIPEVMEALKDDELFKDRKATEREIRTIVKNNNIVLPKRRRRLSQTSIELRAQALRDNKMQTPETGEVIALLQEGKTAPQIEELFYVTYRSWMSIRVVRRIAANAKIDLSKRATALRLAKTSTGPQC